MYVDNKRGGSLVAVSFGVILHMGIVARKGILVVSDKARQKPVASATETS